MALIKNRAVVADHWQTLELAEGDDPATLALPAGQVLFPLAVWLARRTDILARDTAPGLLMQGNEDPAPVLDDLSRFAVIAIHFPKFVDGRGYSLATLLRQRHGYTGELRAVGDVLHDQLFFMQRVGFDAFALKDGKSVDLALAGAFSAFGDTYQAATDQPQPAFRRRA